MGIPIVRLEEIAEVRLGRQRSPKNHKGTHMRPYLRAANIGWEGLLLDDVKTMNFADQEMAVYRLQPGDILVGEASGSPAEVGKPAMWSGEIDECAFQNTLLRVRSRENADPRYLLHFFKYEAMSGNFAARSRGVGIRHLGRESLAGTLLPLPRIEEQRRISDLLDRVDALRYKRREMLVRLDELTDSTFLEMFGDPISNPHGWDSGGLEEFAEISSGITKGRKVNGSPTREVPYMAVVNVQDRRLALTTVKLIEATEVEIQRYRLRYGDLLLTEGGDPDKLGRGSLWRSEIDECIHQNHIFRVRFREPGPVRPLFANWLIGSERGRRYFARSAKQTTGIASINKTQLRQFPMLVPPLDRQIAFERALGDAVAVQQVAIEAQAVQNELFRSIQERAFAGRN